MAKSPWAQPPEERATPGKGNPVATQPKYLSPWHIPPEQEPDTMVTQAKNTGIKLRRLTPSQATKILYDLCDLDFDIIKPVAKELVNVVEALKKIRLDAIARMKKEPFGEQLSEILENYDRMEMTVDGVRVSNPLSDRAKQMIRTCETSQIETALEAREIIDNYDHIIVAAKRSEHATVRHFAERIDTAVNQALEKESSITR